MWDVSGKGVNYGNQAGSQAEEYGHHKDILSSWSFDVPRFYVHDVRINGDVISSPRAFGNP